MTGKPLIWVGATLERLRAFPAAARREAGHQLHLVQLGIEVDDRKPMRSVGPGVSEIRVHAGGESRVFYIAKFAEAVYVLHAFQKKTRKTREVDIEVGRRNLSEVLRRRRTG